MDLDGNRRFAVAICEAIGLKAENVARLSLDFETNGMIRAQAELMLVDGGTLYMTTKEFKLSAEELE